jgi:general stress protein CsbA
MHTESQHTESQHTESQHTESQQIESQQISFKKLTHGELKMSFLIYVIGAVLLIGGLSYVAHLAHVHQQWIIAMDVVILGAALIGASSSTRQKDPN